MIYALAILLPWLALMLKGKLVQGILCLVLQITLIGWLPATIWAIVVINNENGERRHREMLEAVRRGQ